MNKQDRIKTLERNATENERSYRRGEITQEQYLVRKKDVKAALMEAKYPPKKA